MHLSVEAQEWRQHRDEDFYLDGGNWVPSINAWVAKVVPKPPSRPVVAVWVAEDAEIVKVGLAALYAIMHHVGPITLSEYESFAIARVIAYEAPHAPDCEMVRAEGEADCTCWKRTLEW